MRFPIPSSTYESFFLPKALITAGISITNSDSDIIMNIRWKFNISFWFKLKIDNSYFVSWFVFASARARISHYDMLNLLRGAFINVTAYEYTRVSSINKLPCCNVCSQCVLLVTYIVTMLLFVPRALNCSDTRVTVITINITYM